MSTGYNIHFTATTDPMAAITAAIIAAKALHIDNVIIQCDNGIMLSVSQDSRVADIYKIYQLEVAIKNK